MNEIINNPVLWLICSVTVFIVALQAGLFVRLALRNAQSFGLSREKCFKAFRIGMVTAFGPSLGILIVMVGLMTVLGEPLTWMRLSMIVSAANELTAPKSVRRLLALNSTAPTSVRQLSLWPGSAWLSTVSVRWWELWPSRDRLRK